MKKFLVIAMTALFAVSAYAATLTIDGFHEFGGRFYENTNLADGDAEDSRSGAAFTQELRIWARIQIDECTKIVMRMRPTDGGTRVLGAKGPNGAYGLYDQTGRKLFDLAWIEYQANDMFNIQLGRLWGNGDYISSFATLHEGHGYTDIPDPMDGIKVTAKLSDTAKVYGAVYKMEEGFAKTNRVGSYDFTRASNDSDLYVIGADLNFGDVRVMPSLGYGHDATNGTAGDSTTRITGYVGASFGLTDAISMKAALAVDSADLGDDTFTSFGAYAELNAKVTDTVKVGGQVAYISDDDGYSFSAGDSFGWTYLLDDKLMSSYDTQTLAYGNTSGNGFSNGMMIEAYADFAVAEKMTLRGVAAVFMSMSDDENPGNGMNEDAMGFEVDASLAYAFNKATTATVGAAFASLSDWTAEDYDPDPVYALYWKVRTNF